MGTALTVAAVAGTYAALTAAPALAIPGWPKVAGMGRIRHRLSGQAMTNARPITLLSGTMPLPGSAWCPRESSEIARWSPSTHRYPAGTVIANWLGCLGGALA